MDAGGCQKGFARENTATDFSLQYFYGIFLDTADQPATFELAAPHSMIG